MPAYKDKKRGTWFVKFSTTDITGKRKQILKRGFPSKREALHYESFMRTQPVKTNITFQELTNNYLEYRHPRPATLDLYQRLLNSYVPFMEENAAKLSKADLMEWYLTIPDLSTSTKNTLLVIVKAVFRYGHEFYDLPNPTVHLKRFKGQSQEMQVWTPEEFNRFLSVVDNDLYKALYSFLYWSGVRKSEAQALRYTDFEGNVVHIRRQYTEHGFADLKTESSKRTLLLPDALQAILRPLLERCSEAEPFVFGGAEPISKGALRYWWAKSNRLSDVKPIRMHDLRHSFATNMINNGANIVAVSKYLGHSSINMTLRVYTHLLDKTNVEMVNMVDEMMKNGIKTVSQPTESP